MQERTAMKIAKNNLFYLYRCNLSTCFGRRVERDAGFYLYCKKDEKHEYPKYIKNYADAKATGLEVFE